MRLVILAALPAFISFLVVTLADKLCRNKLNLRINKGLAYRREYMTAYITDLLILIQINVYVLNAVFRERL